MNGESGLRVGPATPGGHRGASRARGSEGPGHRTWGSSLSSREVVSSSLHLSPVCVSDPGGSTSGRRALGL